MFYTRMVLALAVSIVSTSVYASQEVTSEVVRQSVPVFVCSVNEPNSRFEGAVVEYRLGGYGINGILVIEGRDQEVLVGTNVSSGGLTSVRSIGKYPEKTTTIFEYRVDSVRKMDIDGRVSVTRFLLGATLNLDGQRIDLTACDSLVEWLRIP